MQELSEDKDSRFDCDTKFSNSYSATESRSPIKQQWNLASRFNFSRKQREYKNASVFRDYSVHAAGDW